MPEHLSSGEMTQPCLESESNKTEEALSKTVPKTVRTSLQVLLMLVACLTQISSLSVLQNYISL